MNDNKTNKVWACVTYEENVSINDIVEYFDKNNIKAIISPIHDDINLDDKVFNKEHRHIMLVFDDDDAKKVREVSSELNTPRPFRVISNISYYEYLTHKNRPQKKQYSEKDIVTIGIDDIDGLLNKWHEENAEYERFINDIQSSFPNYTVKYVTERVREYMKKMNCDRKHALEMVKKTYILTGKIGKIN